MVIKHNLTGKTIKALGTIVLIAGLIWIGQSILTVKPSQAGYEGALKITNEGKAALDYFCKQQPTATACINNDYISYVRHNINEAYGLMKQYINDFSSKANVKEVIVMSDTELKLYCNYKYAVACWDGHGYIAIWWENFTYSDPQKSYSLIAHEMLHAYASGTHFDLHPLEEGVVDALSYEIPEMSVYKSIGYPQHRDIVHEITSLLKLKGWTGSAIKIYQQILEGGSVWLVGTLGETDGLIKINRETCKYEGESRKLLAIYEINNRMKCNYFRDAQAVIDFLKADFQEGKDSGGRINPPFNIDVFPQQIDQGDQFTVKYDVSNKDVKSVEILLTRPKETINTDSKEEVAEAIKEFLEKLGSSELKLQLINTISFNLESSAGEKEIEESMPLEGEEYDIQVIVLISKSSDTLIDASDILEIKSQSIHVSPLSDKPVEDKNINISALSEAELGEKITIDTHFTNLKGNEFMLWITDCEGNFIPKISEDDHQARSITADDFFYKYLWDTQKAGTEACRHTVRVKTFLPTGEMTGMSEHEINITSPGGGVCLVNIEKFEGRAEGNKVTLTWDKICGATYYKIYRDSALLDTTTNGTYINSDVPPGEYTYLVEAWTGEPPDKPDDGGGGGGGDVVLLNASLDSYEINNNSDVNINYQGSGKDVKAIMFVQTKANVSFEGDMKAALAAKIKSMPNDQIHKSMTFACDGQCEDTIAFKIEVTDDRVPCEVQVIAVLLKQDTGEPSADDIIETSPSTVSIVAEEGGGDGELFYHKTIELLSGLWQKVNFDINKVHAAGPISSKTTKVIVTGSGGGGGGGGGKPPATCHKIGVPIPTRGGTKDCFKDLNDFLSSLYEFLAGVVALLAVLMTVYGGIKYVTSQGDSGKTTEAKEVIMGGLIGLAVVLLAGLFIEIFGQG